MSARGQRGVSLAEALAALALLGLAVTTGVSLLIDAASHAERHERAAARLVLAERLMERTLATPFDARESRSFGPGDAALDGRRDLRAEIVVAQERPGLDRIEVTVRDAGGRTRLVALTAPPGGAS